MICCRLIKHTEKLLEEKEEKLCVKVLKTLREMMAIDPEYGEKVRIFIFIIYYQLHYTNLLMCVISHAFHSRVTTKVKRTKRYDFIIHFCVFVHCKPVIIHLNVVIK